jgi:hypothetical protein
MLLLSLGSPLCCGTANAQTDIPEIKMVDGKKLLRLPESLSKQIEKDYPEYRLPTRKDITGPWGYEAHVNPGLPYITWGDYNGDDQIDVAVILVGNKSWKFVVYHKQGNKYVDSLRGHNDNKNPQFTILSTVKKGTPFRFEYHEGGKLNEIKEFYLNDIIVRAVYEGAVSTISFKDGKYEFALFGSH